MSTSAINSSASTASTAKSTTKTSSTDLTTPAGQKNMFLQLMVAQLKNQDPTNPTDASTFTSQLAQYTQLEQTMYIREDADAIKTALSASATTDSSTSTSTQGTN